MPRKSNVPIRICGTKTRTGCKTCQQRHVKCDEGRPICLNCEKKNRTCIYATLSPDTRELGSGSVNPPGSLAPHVESLELTSKPTFDAFSESSIGLQPSPSKSISPHGPRELSELNAVNIFVTHLGRELAGAFSDEIWCRTLPRLAQYEPSVWHGIVAITMLNENARLGPQYASDVRRAIAQYSKAMMELNARLEPDPSDCCKDVVLVSCILFTLFECVQTHLFSALRHIRGGMNLLLEWSSHKKSAGGYLDRTILKPILVLLDSQAIQLGASAFRDYTSLPAINSPPTAPTSFSTANDAHLSLNQIFNRISHWAQWCEPCTAVGNKPGDNWMIAERQSIQSQLTRWDSAFACVAQLRDYEASTLLLLMQRKVLEAFFDRFADGPSELEWDKYLNVFQEAVGFAERYMERTTNNTQEITTRPTLVVAMDLVAPLFLISSKCRHANTRRRALTILKACDRKEGMWDSRLCSRLAEKLIELEESGADEDGFIPESTRICELDVRVTEDDSEENEVREKRLVPDEKGSRRIETAEEAISW